MPRPAAANTNTTVGQSTDMIDFPEPRASSTALMLIGRASPAPAEPIPRTMPNNNVLLCGLMNDHIMREFFGFPAPAESADWSILLSPCRSGLVPRQSDPES